jgi:type I restriction enzyme S subunit
MSNVVNDNTLFKKPPSGWSVMDFNDEAIKILDGDRGVNYPKNDEFFLEEYCLFLNTSNIDNDEFCFDENQFITQEKDSLLRKGKLKRGDFVLTTRGTVGSFAYYDDSVKYPNVRINSGMIIFRIEKKKIDHSYFYFFMKSKFFKNQIQKFVSGSAQPQLPIRDLKQFKMLLPDIDEQKAIASVVSSIYKKIKFLRKQNIDLKQVVESIFKQWFFAFSFPTDNGKRQDSEIGDIPEGWKCCRIGEVIERITERIGRSEQSDYAVLSAVRTGDLVPSSEYFTKQVFSKDISKYIKLQKDDFAYNPARINIGSIGKLEEDVQGAVSPVYVAFRAKENFTNFVSLFIKTARAKKHIELFANGSVRQSLSYDDFASMEIVKPTDDVIEFFNETYEAVYKKTQANDEQIDTLKQMLDTLLPKLMSGELRVG